MRTRSRPAALLVAFLLAFPAPSRAAGPGTSAATFLTLGFGARPLAMGESFVAVADDVSALHYNPAGLALPASLNLGPEPRKYEMMVSESFQFQDIRLTQAGFISRPFGFEVNHLDLSGIEARTSETAQPDGSFGASDMSVGVSYGRKFMGVGLGATAKYIRQEIGQYSASAYAVDFGALHRLDALPLSLGVSVVNLGTPVRFIDKPSPLPLALRLGTAYGMTRTFPHAINLEVDLPRDSGPVFRIGMEYLGFGPFALRAGYRTVTGAQRAAVLGQALGSTASGLSEFYGLFMGAGFRTRFGSIDYTLIPYGELGSTHRLSFSLQFGRRQTPANLGALK